VKDAPLTAEHAHLASLLEAIQRCVYFLDASRKKQSWPLSGDMLSAHAKDVGLFESLSAVNERFGKLQDTLGSAMRHAAVLSGEQTDIFLRTLAFYEKIGVLESITEWQVARATRNAAAHVYETDYAAIAEHFNALNALIPALYGDSSRFVTYCRDTLGVIPVPGDFNAEFIDLTCQGTAGSGGEEHGPSSDPPYP
jgi:hypothetical protein